MGSFDGEVALVTGAASGIGEAAALLFSRGGAKLVVADIDAAGGNDTVEQILKEGGEASFFEIDVSDEAAVEELVDQCVALYGRLDAALNNAGISDRPRSLLDFPTDAWERMLTVNLTSVFFCLKYEIRQMLRQENRDGRRGAIVNTSSGAGLVPAPGQPHYTAAKHGVLGLTKFAAQEFSDRGIRTNAICPGLTDTRLVAASLPTEIRDKLLESMPGGELGRPIDVAAAAVWLCSPDARWVNGQGLVVDGGGVMR